MTEFRGLVPTVIQPNSPLNAAQRYLAASYDSVASFMEVTYPALRGSGRRGRLNEPEQDIFRAAVVVAGAGVDTVLKEAMRGCLHLRVAHNDDARGTYRDWVTQYIQAGQGAVNARRLAELLTNATPQESLMAAYLQTLTSSSLQSQTQVATTLGALGFHPRADKQFYLDSAGLNPLFRTRNQIPHEMDMTPHSARGVGERTRRDRTISDYVQMCHTSLNFTQMVPNRTAELIEEDSE